jgi:hypothetical protein
MDPSTKMSSSSNELAPNQFGEIAAIKANEVDKTTDSIEAENRTSRIAAFRFPAFGLSNKRNLQTYYPP